MQKLVSIICALFFMVVVSGCGKGSTTTVTPMTLPANVSLTSTDVSGKAFFSTSINGYTTYQINADAGQTAAWNSSASNQASPTDTSGTWSISTTGALVLTSPAVSHQFTCIQKETSYFLMSDESGTINRFYFTKATAQAYLDSIIISTSPLSAKLGGSIQGTPLSLPFTNFTTLVAGNTAPPTVYTDITSNGKGAAASFNQPTGITTDGSNLYVADFRNNIIRKIVIADGTVTRLAGSPLGIAGYANSTDGTGDTATFNVPAAVTTDGEFIYVADTGNNSIRKIDISSGAVTLIAGSTTGVAGSVDSLNGSDARFNQPTGITTDGTNLYVADSANDTIRKIVISSGAVVTLAGAAATAGSSDSADGTGATARFNKPARITTDGSNLYVTDFGNGTVRKIAISTGTVTTIAGVAGALGSADGTGTDARFSQPNGVTTDGKYLYVTDSFKNTIRMIDKSSGAVTTLPHSYITPVGITTDGISLFVAETYILSTDSNNNPTYTYGNTIRKIN